MNYFASNLFQFSEMTTSSAMRDAIPEISLDLVLYSNKGFIAVLKTSR